MKKEDFAGIFVYLLLIAIAIIYGLTILRPYGASSGLGTGGYIGFVIGAILTGIVLNAIIFELAHVIGAKAGRYKILSVCILGLTIIPKEKGFSIKFKGFDGLTGETKILPKEGGKKPSNPTPFLTFGTIFYGIALAAIIVAFRLLSDAAKPQPLLKNIAYFFLTVGVVGGMIWLYNFIPVKLDTVTDGARLTMISNPKNKEAFNELLKIEHEVQLGHSDVEIKTFTSITKFTMDLNLNKVYMLLDQKKYKEAEELVDIILTNGKDLAPKLYLRANAQKIYINIMSKPLEEAKEYYEKEVPVSIRRGISNDYSMPSIRSYLLMSGLLDKSLSESLIALNHVNKAFKATPKERKATEALLFNEALTRVSEAHPDWGIDDYKLIYEEKK